MPPQLVNDSSDFDKLMEAFAILNKLRSLDDIMESVGLANLPTAADMIPLTGEGDRLAGLEGARLGAALFLRLQRLQLKGLIRVTILLLAMALL